MLSEKNLPHFFEIFHILWRVNWLWSDLCVRWQWRHVRPRLVPIVHKRGRGAWTLLCKGRCTAYCPILSFYPKVHRFLQCLGISGSACIVHQEVQEQTSSAAFEGSEFPLCQVTGGHFHKNWVRLVNGALHISPFLSCPHQNYSQKTILSLMSRRNLLRKKTGEILL